MKDIRDTLIFPNKGIPKCFTNNSLIENLEKIYELYSDSLTMFNELYKMNGDKICSFKTEVDNRTGVKKATEPIQFIHSKKNNDIRIFSIPNPLVQIPFHFYIYENRYQIIDEQNVDSTCFFSKTSYYIEDEMIVRYWDYETGAEIEVVGSIHLKNYNASKLKEVSLTRGKYYSLKLDIANFYDNIYTHSISWDTDDPSMKLIESNIDVVARAGNRNETKGIIIGPYTSSLFAEIILSKVDREMSNYLNGIDMEVTFSRYSDDYFFYCDSREFLESVIKTKFESILKKYRLYINSSKTRSLSFPFRDSRSEEIDFSNLKRNMEEINRPTLEDELTHFEYELANFFIDDMESLLENGGNLNYFLYRLLGWIYEEDSTFSFENIEITKMIINYFINLSFKYHYVLEPAFEIVISLCKQNEFLFEEYAEILLNKYKNITVEKKETHLIWITYFISLAKLDAEKVYHHIKEVLEGESILSHIIAIDTILLNYFEDDFVDLIKGYLLKVENDIKEYNSNVKSIAWHTKYWMVFYTNNVRWNLHENDQFSGTIFSIVNIENYDVDNLDKRFKLIKILKDMNVKFFEKYIEEDKKE